MVLNHWFSLSNRNSFNVASLRRFQGLAKNPLQPIRVRSSINTLNFNSFFGMAGDTFFKGIGTCSISSSSRASGFLLHASSSQLTSDSFTKKTTRYHNGIPANKLLVIQKATHHSFSQQCRSRKWCEANSLKYLVLHWVLVA